MRYLFIYIFVLFSCNNEKKELLNQHKIHSLIWTQNSAEYKALCYQAFNTAKINLDSFFFIEKEFDKPLAIITDVDETVLDNSPYDGRLILNNISYNRESWVEWGNLETAKAIPGSVDLLN